MNIRWEGLLHAGTKIFSTATILIISLHAAKSGDEGYGAIALTICLIPAIAGLLDFGLSLSLLNYLSKESVLGKAESRLVIATLLGSSVLGAGAYAVIYGLQATSTPIRDLYGISLVFILPAVVGLYVAGTAAQRVLVATNNTKTQSKGYAVLFVSLLALALLLNDSLSIVDYALLFVVPPPIVDVLIAVNILQKLGQRGLVGEGEAGLGSVCRRILRGCGFFAILQLVSYVAYLNDSNFLIGRISDEQLSAYMLFQRLALTYSSAVALMMVPLWRQRAREIGMKTLAEAKNHHFRNERLLLLVAIALTGVFAVLSLFVMKYRMGPGSVQPHLELLCLGASFQVFSTLVSAYVGILFSNISRRAWLVLAAPFTIAALISVKAALVPQYYYLVPVASALVVILMSTVPQYFLVKKAV